MEEQKEAFLLKKEEQLIIQQKSAEKQKKVVKRTKCERYSRVVGYFRPVSQWNNGKQAEWEDRKTFVLN